MARTVALVVAVLSGLALAGCKTANRRTANAQPHPGVIDGKNKPAGYMRANQAAYSTFMYQ